MSTKLRDLWRKHDIKILSIFVVVLIAFVAFRAGQTHERGESSAKIDVSINQLTATNPAEQKMKVLGDTLERKGITVAQLTGESPKDVQKTGQENVECLLIGSKNSDKYHLPSCKRGKTIKEENRVCFSSEKDAQDKGYQPAKCCH